MNKLDKFSDYMALFDRIFAGHQATKSEMDGYIRLKNEFKRSDDPDYRLLGVKMNDLYREMSEYFALKKYYGELQKPVRKQVKIMLAIMETIERVATRIKEEGREV
ncbi:hypothetical protein [Fictibacillus terranigra]|uniref:Uncharacterized protein n=1 Tax=Fictibacillus terranigra TaxID=3058424 RepID=A0ABT8E6T7_9BACL|nr:hypothetical protein [Fictibacillus sp. CENA-BCM004]MDN4073623.1 hypothetical protein [Fictibacillus sp. CENA-BCM004]